MGACMGFDIGEAIQHARSMRSRFLVDTPSAALDNTAELIDRFWPIESGQLDRTRMRTHIYRVDKKATDQGAEFLKRRNSAIIAKLSLRDWGYADNTGKAIPQLIDELDRDLALIAKDGLTPYERYVEKRVDPSVSSETLRHNRGLTPKVRAQLFSNGLATIRPVEKRKGRKRLNPISENTILRTAPFIRSRENWRAGEIYFACRALHSITQWANDPNTDAADCDVLAQRYRLSELYVSQSKIAPETYAVRLAVAITSAKHLQSGTDHYSPDDDVARGAFFFYGHFLQATKGKKNGTGEMPSVFLNKLLESLE
ncbi:hypothetical protein DSM25559_5283 [Agrobacterium rosae]|uniref:Uncharacterized protein n=2 Tax=Agrobacterium rosae TaxID=1972867 RepID=A0A1R3U387_9HYPH|nr:hypothetical protein DSM25559_5283 [Agrobacterium rosae]